MYFLDTNTCIYFLNGKYESLRAKILSTPPNEISIPSIVKAELLLGAYKSQKKKENVEKVEKLLEPFEVIPFFDLIAYVYADISNLKQINLVKKQDNSLSKLLILRSRVRNETEKVGEKVGPNDLLIASIVKFHDGILVTNNVKEFKRIKGLKIENWVK